MDFKRILKIEKLSKSFGFGNGRTQALNSITFDVLDGEFLAIMGSSGSGKTTLLNCISTMSKASKGNIYFEDENIRKFSEKRLAKYRSEDISIIYQDYELLDNISVRENILMPLIVQNRKDLIKSFDSLIEEFGISEIINKFPLEISGGEKQKTATIRALITNPKIILADEPTGAMDSSSALKLLEKFSKLNEYDNKTILMVTHDISAASFASRILFIKDGSIYHEIRKKDGEKQKDYYDRISLVIKQLTSSQIN